MVAYVMGTGGGGEGKDKTVGQERFVWKGGAGYARRLVSKNTVASQGQTGQKCKARISLLCCSHGNDLGLMVLPWQKCEIKSVDHSPGLLYPHISMQFSFLCPGDQLQLC